MRSTAGFGAAALSLLSFATPGSAFFRMSCPGRVVTERADPIVNPGKASSHVHTISGGNAFDFTMSYEDTQTSTCSSCPIKQDLSNYWTPSLYYQRKDGKFQDVPQSGDGVGKNGGMTVYYLQRGGPNNDKLKAYPKGFRMLAGDPFKRAPGTDFASKAVSYVCLDYKKGSTYTDRLPNVTCPDGLRAQIFFPSCWDGVNLDSPDHKSHMAYPTKYSYDNGPCPATHPVHMISIFYEVIYSTAGFEWWNGTQQPFVFAQGDPTGFGFHGDWLNGWQGDVLQNATDRCTNDSGLLSDCDVFDFFTPAQTDACMIPPKIDEPVTGVLDALPGCNPVTWGPERASPASNCPAAVIGAPKSYSTNVTGWDYLGCGSDGSSRTFTGSDFKSSSMTVESCLSYCKSRGFHYAGLEYSQECYCGDSLADDRAPVKGVLGNCIAPCAGNSSQYCGGSNRLSIYYSKTVDVTITCPSGNMTTYTNPNGTTFMAECGMDHAGGDMKMVSANTLQGCIDTCGATTGCKAVALSGQACYLKSSIGELRRSPGVQAAKLVDSSSSSSSPSSDSSSSKTSAPSTASASGASSSVVISSTIKSSSATSAATSAAATSTVPLCPNLNATTYTEPSTGFQFLIECGIDHAGGDMKMVYVNNLAACISACATTTGCVDVSLSGNACYMKKTVGRTILSNGVKGAKLIVASSSSASSDAAPTSQQQKRVAATSTTQSTFTTMIRKTARAVATNY